VPSDLEMALFDQELAELGDVPESKRWHLERDPTVPLGLLITMHSIKKPDELYRARFRWTGLFDPASLKFLNLQTGAQDDVAAWPQCRGFRPTALDACVNWTAEGFALHPEWRNSPKTAFLAPEKPVRFALLKLQSVLDSSYEGRGHR
jgi:hypothetical protein